MSAVKIIKKAWSKRLVRTADRYLQSISSFHGRSYSHDDAIRKCKLAIRLTPAYPLAYLVLGNALYGKGSYEEAIAQYKNALKLDPDLYFGQLHLAELLHQQADTAAEKKEKAQSIQLYTEALSAYRKASSLQKGGGKSHADRVGKVLEALRRYDNAVHE
jgi:tetratricopeptide (TPR) repeat protein